MIMMIIMLFGLLKILISVTEVFCKVYPVSNLSKSVHYWAVHDNLAIKHI